MKLKHSLKLLLLIAALSAPTAHAMTYAATNADTLLVFRQDNFNDVVFSLGSVSNLLALPNGAVTNISYDTNLVKANFNNTFAGVNFIVLAATDSAAVPLRYWATCASATTVVSNTVVSPFTSIRGGIESIGNAATANTLGNANPFVVAASDLNSYSTLSSFSTFGGVIKFVCEAPAGATQTFWEVGPRAPSAVGPAKKLGSFSMNATTGRITYTSGTNSAVALIASRITGISRSNGVSRVSFTTTNGNNYRLLFSTNLVTWLTNTAAGTIAGNNATNILSDTNAAGRAFYRIQSF